MKRVPASLVAIGLALALGLVEFAALQRWRLRQWLASAASGAARR